MHLAHAGAVIKTVHLDPGFAVLACAPTLIKARSVALVGAVEVVMEGITIEDEVSL